MSKKKKSLPFGIALPKMESSLQQDETTMKKDDKGSPQSVEERIVDRLDLQLLITVIVFFVSGWAFMNSEICEFTESANHNEIINYMLVHYILTAVLFLCVYITYLKGKYIIDKKAISRNKDKYFKLFMDSWFYTLVLCLLIMWFCSYIPWWLCSAILIVLLFLELRSLKFEKLKMANLLLWFIGCFPFFISTMTVMNRNINVQVDKEYYSIDDDILITVSSQGYACSHKLVCLGEEELYPNTGYLTEKNMIVLKATSVRNNEFSVGTISPASGMPNFFVYPLRKMFDQEIKYIDTKMDNNKKHINYKSKNINIRP